MTAGTAVPAEPPATARTPQVLLAHHLKQLELPTVLREYDKVARECARDGVDHPRYLCCGSSSSSSSTASGASPSGGSARRGSRR